MRLENRKILTAKRAGIVLFLVVAVLLMFLQVIFYFNAYNEVGDKIEPKSTAVGKKHKTPITTPASLRAIIGTTKATRETSANRIKTVLNISQHVTKTNSTLNMTKIMSHSNTMSAKISTIKRRRTSTVFPLTTTPTKHFTCLNLMGRLGNLMFQYASAYGIARSKGMNVIISEKEHITKIFHLDRGGKLVKDTSMCRGVETRGESQASAFDKNLMNFKNNKNIALWGYLQSFKYFENVSGEIRYQFTFRDSIKSKAENILREILHRHSEKHSNETKNWTFVAVHVRRGDMVNHPHGYMVAPKEYFYRTQNMFRALYKHILFVVCSDDIRWCKDNLQNENTYFVTGNSPAVDMAVLSSCNHTITSVGSFSWWSAWLSSGIVTYYFPPARPGSGLRRAYSKDFSDYFPPNWIRVKS